MGVCESHRVATPRAVDLWPFYKWDLDKKFKTYSYIFLISILSLTSLLDCVHTVILMPSFFPWQAKLKWYRIHTSTRSLGDMKSCAIGRWVPVFLQSSAVSISADFVFLSSQVRGKSKTGCQT